MLACYLKSFLFSTVIVVLSFSLNAQPRQTALVIGNSKYINSPLKNPVNDARDMSLVLEKLGYEVISAYDCKRGAMRKAIRDFYQQIKQGGVGLFYYAGHGLQLKDENYLVPVDSNIYEEFEIEDQCVRLSSVLSAMANAKNDVNIVILDACRNNPFSTGFRSATRGLAKVDAPAGTFLAYATAPGSVAMDNSVRGLTLKTKFRTEPKMKEIGDQGNGLYTAKLLKYILTPDLSIEEVFKRVRIEVMGATDKKQIPWESSSLISDYSFTSGRDISFAMNGALDSGIPEVAQSQSQKVIEKRSYFNPDSEEYEFYDGNRFKRSENMVKDMLLNCTWLIVDEEIFTIDQAKEYCRRNTAGFRIPTDDELLSLMSKKEDGDEWGYINSNVFHEHSRTSQFWTGSKSIPFWIMSPQIYVDFKEGKKGSMAKTNNCALLLIKK